MVSGTITILPRIEPVVNAYKLKLHARDVVGVRDGIELAGATFTIKDQNGTLLQTLPAPDGTADVILNKGLEYIIDFAHPGNANYKGVYNEWAVGREFPGGQNRFVHDWDGQRPYTPNKDTDLYLIKIPSIDGEPIVRGYPNPDSPFTHYSYTKRELRLVAGGGKGFSKKYADPMKIYELDSTGSLAPIGLSQGRDAIGFYEDLCRGAFHVNLHDQGTLPATNFIQHLVDPTMYGAGTGDDGSWTSTRVWAKVLFHTDTRPTGVPNTWTEMAEEEAHALFSFNDLSIPSLSGSFVPSQQLNVNLSNVLFQKINQTTQTVLNRVGTVLVDTWIEFPAGTKYWNPSDYDDLLQGRQ